MATASQHLKPSAASLYRSLDVEGNECAEPPQEARRVPYRGYELIDRDIWSVDGLPGSYTGITMAKRAVDQRKDLEYTKTKR